ncbi:MAG: 16S rRNA (uracil(1498)-N(3))-methyltransferase [Coriobacteriaceae bacterium]|jgi:16S rRNA (uracil1498-N3)-methyltransferase|nr:16S rRNA (uracil(1498)-N(3))-methyltransferase [Coriobacteriaceae bacterium]
MALPHFFLDNQVLGEEGTEEFPLRLSAADMRHAAALRLAPKEHVAIIDAAQDYFECELVSCSHGQITARIAQKHLPKAARPSVVLVQGLAKGEKMDAIIRQTTELGIGAIIPFSAERSVVRLDPVKASAKALRWREVAKSAAMQSGQQAVPEVSAPLSLDEVCAFAGKAHALLVCWEEERQGSIRASLAAALDRQGVSAQDARVVLVVGPEGGLCSPEVECLMAAHPFAYTVGLGPSILRTETAAVVACALALHELGALA